MNGRKLPRQQGEAQPRAHATLHFISDDCCGERTISELRLWLISILHILPTMSEPIPESIPTSQDPRSKRPVKRRALTPVTQQANQVEALFAKPERDIPIPSITAVAKKHGVPAPPEIVANVQGSSAGAGSGEFHVYKASRRREYQRVKLMDEEVAREKADEEFEKKRDELRKKDEEKTGKNRKRREKNKRKKEAKNGRKDEVNVGAPNGDSVGGHVSVSSLKQSRETEIDEVPNAIMEDVGVTIHDDD